MNGLAVHQQIVRVGRIDSLGYNTQASPPRRGTIRCGSQWPLHVDALDFVLAGGSAFPDNQRSTGVRPVFRRARRSNYTQELR